MVKFLKVFPYSPAPNFFKEKSTYTPFIPLAFRYLIIFLHWATEGLQFSKYGQ